MKREIDMYKLLYAFSSVIQNLENELENIPKNNLNNIVERVLYKNSINAFYESMKLIERIYEIE